MTWVAQNLTENNNFIQPADYFFPISIQVVYIVGEGNGTPLQYSCLENPMDGGAWSAAVHGVAKSRTRLSDFTFTFHFHALEKEMATHSSVLAWRIPGTVGPGGLPSMGSHRVGHDWSDLAAAAAREPWKSSYHVKTQQEDGRLWDRKPALTRHQIWWSWTSQPPEPWEINSRCLAMQSRCFVIEAPSDYTNLIPLTAI